MYAIHAVDHGQLCPVVCRFRLRGQSVPGQRIPLLQHFFPRSPLLPLTFHIASLSSTQYVINFRWIHVPEEERAQIREFLFVFLTDQSAALPPLARFKVCPKPFEIVFHLWMPISVSLRARCWMRSWWLKYYVGYHAETARLYSWKRSVPTCAPTTQSHALPASVHQGLRRHWQTGLAPCSPALF